jgi:energy-coupling factor transporter ATP-binding protein EcfA2
MLGTLQLEKFRGFETYALTDLTRVNLLVGKNNCGKTSILEAIHFLVSGGDPFVLTGTANRRGEVSDAGATARGWRPDVSHFFFGHRLEPGTRFRLSGDDYEPVSVEVHVAEDDYGAQYVDDDSERAFPLVLHLERNAQRSVLPLRENGSLIESRIRFRSPRRTLAGPLPRRPEDLTPPFEFVTPDSLDPDRMRAIWDRVLTEDRESEVIDAMKLLDSDLKSIRFLTSDASRARSDRAGVLLGFKGGGPRVPLGSYGDGMRRLLALALAFVQTAGGVLLVDEIDTGLHWTVMEDMWRLVVDTARKSSVQVFATTHSYDCIRGLSSLVESRPDLAGEVAIQKIGRAIRKAVHLDADDIQVAVEQNIEMR